MINIVIFGPPGAGKGTQSKNISQKYGLELISTGDLLRRECESGSELGKEIARRIDGGNFVPDSMIIEMVAAFYHKNAKTKGFVLDGFPRTKEQSVWFDNFLSEHFGAKVNVMLSMEAEQEELIRRVLNRGIEDGRADDQDRQIVLKRMTIYHEVTHIVKQHYMALGRLSEIDGLGTVSDVFNRICSAIDKAILKPEPVLE